jgi:hypothetical protein
MTSLSKPTVKQHLAAIRKLLDYLTTGGILDVNPASAVRGPKIRRPPRQDSGSISRRSAQAAGLRRIGYQHSSGGLSIGKAVAEFRELL